MRFELERITLRGGVRVLCTRTVHSGGRGGRLRLCGGGCERGYFGVVQLSLCAERTNRLCVGK